MAAPPRGRGYAVSSKIESFAQPLRRPGESGLRQRLGSDFQDNVEESKEDKVEKLCDQISAMKLYDPKKELSVIDVEVKSLCDTCDNLQNFVDKIISFALKSKWNAHAIALFSEHIDISIENLKLRTLLLRKLQSLYREIKKTYLTIDKFLMEATFLCEIFFHVRIDGNCIEVLANPILDYLGMLIDGGTLKEIEVFSEQFPKCFKNFKASDEEKLDNLLIKIRKQLVGEETTITVKAMLLEIFESILLDWKPLNNCTKSFYDSLSKPIVRICE